MAFLWKPNAVLFWFVLFLCFCGLYTYLCSTVYRATLPELPRASLPHWGVHVTLAVVGSSSFGADCAAKAKQVQTQLSSEEFQFEVSCLRIDEQAAISETSLSRLVQERKTSSSSYTFFFVESGASEKLQWFMGANRAGWVRVPQMELAIPGLIKLLQRILLPQAAEIHEPLRVPAVSSYTLSLTLLNGLPLKGGYTWEIEEAIRRYLEPFIAQLQPAFELLTDSQVLYFADLFHEVKFDKQKNVHTIAVSKLREFVGNTKWNVVSPLSTNSIELLVFVPPASHRPLLIKQDAKVLSPSFIVPRWGGVYILNDLPNSTMISATELAPAMQAFIAQLRIMFGLSANEHSLAGTDVVWSSANGIADWELDALLRSRLRTYLHETTDTLRSLYELLAAQTHMPVTDIISQAVQEALEGMSRAVFLSSKGDLYEAMAAARTAYAAANSAFFHPSLMPLLYFPDEHLYAVYAPFFMPVVIPIWSAFASVAKKWFKGIKTD